MSAMIDIISPTYLGGDLIKIEVDDSSRPLLNNRPIRVNFDYSLADADGGIILPLIVTIQSAEFSGEAGGFRKKFFERSAPNSYIFTVTSAGLHLITIREYAHNRWQGKLEFEVGGDQVPTRSARGRLL